VPFKLDEKFVGREDIIKEIDDRIMRRGTSNNHHSRVALVGIGGVGLVRKLISLG
jgi:hypothetical protein